MSRRSKKRNKPYTGKDAKVQGPTVHRYSAEVRGPIKEWWTDHKRVVKWTAGIGGSIIVVVWLLVEAVNLIF